MRTPFMYLENWCEYVKDIHLWQIIILLTLLILVLIISVRWFRSRSFFFTNFTLLLIFLLFFIFFYNPRIVVSIYDFKVIFLFFLIPLWILTYLVFIGEYYQYFMYINLLITYIIACFVIIYFYFIEEASLLFNFFVHFINFLPTNIIYIFMLSGNFKLCIVYLCLFTFMLFSYDLWFFFFKLKLARTYVFDFSLNKIKFIKGLCSSTLSNVSWVIKSCVVFFFFIKNFTKRWCLPAVASALIFKFIFGVLTDPYTWNKFLEVLFWLFKYKKVHTIWKLLSLILWSQLLVVTIVLSSKHPKVRYFLILLQLFLIIFTNVYVVVYRDSLPFLSTDMFIRDISLHVMSCTHIINFLVIVVAYKFFKVSYSIYEVVTTLLVLFLVLCCWAYVISLYFPFLVTRLCITTIGLLLIYLFVR